MKPFALKAAPQSVNSLSLLQISLRRSYSAFSKIRIDEATKKEFAKFAEGSSPDPYENFSLVREQSTKALKSIISKETQEALRSFGQRGRPVMLLENCPIVGSSNLPPTPTSSTKPGGKDFVSESFMLGISGLIGADPYVIGGVRDGSVVNQVIPLNPNSISGSGSKKEFNFHNEVVHERCVPDFFILLCLRGNPMAKTGFCLIEDIIEFLPPQILEELQQPNFIMRSGDKSVFKEEKELRCPILTRDKSGNFDIRLNLAPDRCEGATENAKIALNYISECINNEVTVHDVSLSGGEGLLIHDRKLLHKRTAFDESAEKEGGKRWVQRMNLRSTHGGSLKR
jgi:L-asparagine oxygenase